MRDRGNGSTHADARGAAALKQSGNFTIVSPEENDNAHPTPLALASEGQLGEGVTAAW
jgi:hypothetical protein